MMSSVRENGLQVAELLAPRWQPGGRTKQTVIPFPARHHVELAIRLLDGQELNDLYLKTSEAGTYLGICRGAGRYMVAICEHNQRFGQLLNTQDLSDVQEDIICGGQLTRFAAATWSIFRPR